MRPSLHDRGGFVLVFVVFMLFAVSVAAATGYLMVNTEFAMAKHSSDGAEALTLARAGLERYVAQQIGVVDDSVSYAMGNGVVLVTSRRLFQQDSVTDMYYVRAEGTVADVFAPNTPARRVVGSYALHHKRPLPHHAAMLTSAATVHVDVGGTIHGWDANSGADCQGAGADPIAGAIARTSVTEASPSLVEGTPTYDIWAGGYAQILDSIGVRWDVLTDSGFPLEFDGVWPNYASLPADSFPVVRMTGWLSTNQVGRGVLIVDGMFDPGTTFSWDGIIIAKNIDDYIEGSVRGLLIGGIGAADNTYATIYNRGNLQYYSCNVYAANESLAYLELVDHTVFETY